MYSKAQAQAHDCSQKGLSTWGVMLISALVNLNLCYLVKKMKGHLV